MATIQVRIDDNIKAEADLLFSELGLDTSTAVRIFISSALDAGGIPFPIIRDSNRDAILRKAIARRKSGNKFYSIDECIEDIDMAILEVSGDVTI